VNDLPLRLLFSQGFGAAIISFVDFPFNVVLPSEPLYAELVHGPNVNVLHLRGQDRK
jgi:hypothetical protein